MATNLVKETELGFAEFTSVLISEILKAVVNSILIQEKNVAELEQEALSSPEEYANRNLTDDAVRAEVIRLFPHSTGRKDKSAVDPMEPYDASKEETPPIFKKIGYTIQKSDLAAVKGKTAISAAGYNNIFAATRIELAKQNLNALKTVVKRGIPRVYVDNGHVSSKLTLRLENEAASTPSPEPSTPNVSKLGGIAVRRLIAQPINVSRPEFLTLRGDILSEIEITFKTVVP
jgi:hypothetical protein